MKTSRALVSTGGILLLALLAPIVAAARPPVPGLTVPQLPSPPVKPASFAGAELTVASITSPPADARAGHVYSLHGVIVNDGSARVASQVVVHLLRVGSRPLSIGRASLGLAAHDSRAFGVRVRLPSGLRDGSYALVACVRHAALSGALGCATAERHLKIGSARVRTTRVLASTSSTTCSSGAHSLSPFGAHVYPETGNGGYTSVHTDVFLNYDTTSNLFLPGTHVVLTDRATQCLTDFSLDFERTSQNTKDGPDLSVASVVVNGTPASFSFVQPTYPGDPNGQNDPDPRAHEAGQLNPVGGPDDNPLPPACSPELMSTNPNKQFDLDGTQCPANKLVVMPSSPIPSGAQFTVEVNYTGRPGVHNDGDGTTEGWFRVNQPNDAGSFVTTEPVATEDWMPLNDHPSAKPTYDFYDTVPLGKTAIANGELVSQLANLPDGNFPGGSITWHWHSPEGIASYLVENSIGSYDLSERLASSGIQYYEAQDLSIPKNTAAANKQIMDMQEAVMNFQSGFNGPYPFTTDGIVIGVPNAGFEEEMQTKITFANAYIDLDLLHHENMHQWWGDNVSESNYNLTFFKEGLATLGEFFFSAANAQAAAGGSSAAFEQELVDIFDQYYAGSDLLWTGAPSNPRPYTLFSGSKTYIRPGIAYIALRRILGPANFDAALQQLQRTYRQGSVTEAQLESGFKSFLPTPSAACKAALTEFFTEWWDAVYPPGGGPNRPQLTAPGLDGGGFHC
ncbi:MAG TPA: M1 family aminopeptidase [Gaiellaceae bacterium]|nr:M1 family aminopeptidase [Gaiellaceae bacterium]